MSDYMIYLVAVACESQAAPAEPNTQSITVSVITDFLRFLATSNNPITRTGTERAADILFARPDVAAFFRDNEATTALRDTIHQEILPAANQIFRDHWNYIIGPTMDEHIAVALLTIH